MSKRIARNAMFIALAMIFSYVEAMIPLDLGVPGVKLGIANIIVVVGIYIIDSKDVFMISMVRIILTGILFGNIMSIAYSMAGGILSFFTMLLMKKVKGFSIVGVSILGGVMHNIGQIIIAIVIVENLVVAIYLPILVIAGATTGLAIGLLAKKIIDIVLVKE